MKKKEYILCIFAQIKNAFAAYNCHIELKKFKCSKDGKSFFFNIGIKPGTKYQSLFSSADNVSACLGIPIITPMQNGCYFFLLVSYEEEYDIALGPLLDLIQRNKSPESIPIAIGFNALGMPFVEDLKRIQHAVYAGTTNCGKSTGLINFTLSLVLLQSPNTVNLLLFDIGSDTFDVLEDIPHLSYPIVKDKLTGSYVLTELTKEMERRILLSEDERRYLPEIVCVIDEFTSLIADLNDKKLSKKYKNTINNLLRRGRKAKIHMILATQNATQEAMQSDIGNITTRFVYSLPSLQSSRAVLGEAGAETLCRSGEFMYKACYMRNACRLKGALATDEEISEWVGWLKSLSNDASHAYRIPLEDCKTQYFKEAIEDVEPKCDVSNNLELSKIVLFVLSNNTISASQLKKEFNIGNRVNSIMDKLFGMGLISEKNSNKARIVIPTTRSNLTAETVNLLLLNGVSEELILDAFARRVAAEKLISIE
ncbi:MAG: hypothetical protein MRZ61_09225 [Oscillospiraceae bacterium]|nr:hypothetical protein [Oscillospiraceae bacterium]